ncbi:hypothetical protein GCM10007868_06700 [Gluconobacter frateurii]|uniref:Uncharacterized protein n=1 Tax=Gluconobacter frateurii NRIC 0228 TaxID=1307946 RepID=A0ABQ0QFV1_9PROT|nr:hypothetical protein AA0228_3018 [Gluconobacter frateurii NRIC 0228]GLP89595.1 hypothetical protein GCM10007868_06700 [Gluconobacter frateurii]
MKSTKQDILKAFSDISESDITTDDTHIEINFPSHTYKAPISVCEFDICILHSFIISHRKRKKDQIN